MSHTTTVKSVAITDIAALRSAVEDLKAKGVNCHLEEGADITPRMYYSRQAEELKGQTPYVLRLPNAQFDVGFQRVENDGEVSYVPVTDLHGGSVAREIGANCKCDPQTAEERTQMAFGGLMQGYAKHATMNAAIASGYTVENMEYNDTTGELHIHIDASTYSM